MNLYDDIPEATKACNNHIVATATTNVSLRREFVLDSSASKKRKRSDAKVLPEDHDPPLSERERVLQKIEQHLQHDKNPKFFKAINLLQQFIDSSELTDESAATATFDLLARFIGSERDISNETYRASYESLFSSVWEKRHVFPSVRLPLLKAWHLRACVSNRILVADDSFDFAKNVQFLCDCIKELPLNDSYVMPEDKACFVDAVLMAMEKVLRKYSVRLFARQPVESVFTAAIEKRMLLSYEFRERLDVLTNQLESEKRKNTSFVGQQSIRTFNSAAHPLQKRSAGMQR